MSAVLRVTGEDLQYLATHLSALADELHAYPFRNAGGLGSCGSGRVAAAGDAANEHFALRALMIESELRDLGKMASNVAAVTRRQDQNLANPGDARALPTGGSVVV